MKRQTFLLPLIGSILLLYSPSCINKDYDWDNLNKEATFQVGNIPLGNVTPIRIDSILEDRGDTEFLYDEAGNIYLEYTGDIDINLPEFEMKEVEDKSTRLVQRTFGAGSNFPAVFPIEEDGTLTYDLDEPDLDNDDDWDILINSIQFEESNLFIDIYLAGVTFPEAMYDLDITMTFPAGIQFTDHEDNREIINNVLSFSLDPSIINSSTENIFTYGPLHMAEFDYLNQEDIVYTAGLTSQGNGFEITEYSEFKFQMTIRTEELEPSFVYADANFLQLIDGEVDDIGSLSETLGEDGKFTIYNPAMIFDLETNLGYDLNIAIDKLEANGPTEDGILTNVTAPNNMHFVAVEKGSTRFTTYYIAQNNVWESENFIPKDLNPLTEVKPELITYDVTAKTEGDGMRSGFFPYNNPFIEAGYTFHIPFNFKEIVTTIEERLDDAFSEDIAEKLFNNPCEFRIVADEVKVQLGGTAAAKENATVTVTAVVYDYNNNKINIRVEPAVLSNGEGSLEIVMHIGENDTERMKMAKHLSFDFKIEGKELKLNKSDYIEINKLKFKTTGGISFEF